MLNYYELLGVKIDASVKEIEAAIKKMRRQWNNRANNPNADIRAEAEQRVRNISEAERTLLDAEKRAAFDVQLNNKPIFSSTAELSDEDEDWLNLAIEYDDRKDYDSLAQLMAQITRKYPDNPRAWLWRGISSEYQERISDSEYEIKKAISLDPTSAVFYSLLGELYASQDQFQLAEKSFQKAAELDQDGIDSKLSLAECQRVQGKHNEALALARDLYEMNRTSERAQYIYSLALYSHTMQSISYNRAFDDYIITNEAQLLFLKQKYPLFESLPRDNEDVQEIVEKVKGKISIAEKNQYKASDKMPAYIAAAIFSFLLLIMDSGMQFLGIIFLAVLIAVYIYRHNIPGWKWQKRNAGAEVKHSGLQS